jgi:hypothetical protein
MTRSHKSFGAAPKNFYRKPFRVLMGLKALQDDKKTDENLKKKKS